MAVNVQRAKDGKEKQILPAEVVNMEKQLWALINSKGPMSSDVQDLYHKVRLSYKNIILGDHDLVELQDVEFSLWKLHYKHIDEFRKRMKRSSTDAESAVSAKSRNVADSARSYSVCINGFKSFLSDAIEFYQNLILRIRQQNGLHEKSSINGKEVIWVQAIEPRKLPKCQFLCHRFLICLGDLSRYQEQYEKPDTKSHDWSTAARCYLEATMIWPDSGNPHNQMAVLATYVGDDFLALYHCIRSLAVQEPFPDAQDNLNLLFERNRSANPPVQSSEPFFDFTQPLERVSVQKESHPTSTTSNCSVAWTSFVRMISFFYIESSMNEFPRAFAFALKDLKSLLDLDESQLRPPLESYQHLDFIRRGPFRAMQAVSIFIFSIWKLFKSPGIKDSGEENNMQQHTRTQYALAATFIFIGRMVEKCLKAKSISSSPLLPAILVFVEWCRDMLDDAEAYMDDEKSSSAISYFFCAFSKLLNHFDISEGEVTPQASCALWEDYELRGFAPLADAQASFNFSEHLEHVDHFESGTEYRTHRIIRSAMNIASKPTGSHKWIFYNNLERKFYAIDPKDCSDRSLSKECGQSGTDITSKKPQQICRTAAEPVKQISEENAHKFSVTGKSAESEDEEVILLKPLTRFNSAPLHTLTRKVINSPEVSGARQLPYDECLRRATSLLVAQDQSHNDSFSFHPDASYSKPLGKPESTVKDTTAYKMAETPMTAGPPSLSSWVLNKGSLSEKEKKIRDVTKNKLSPIEEIASPSLTGLTISGTEDSATTSSSDSNNTHHISHYSTPAPSAPLLPDDAVWFTDNQARFPDHQAIVGVSRTENVYNVPCVSDLPYWNTTHAPVDYGFSTPGLPNGYPQYRGLSSSEWLRQYRHSHNIEHPPGHLGPLHFYPLVNHGNISGHSLLDQWGVPLASGPPLHPGFFPAYVGDEHRKEELTRDLQFQNTISYDRRDGPQPLLQYLKEKEWQLQLDPTLRGPTYMGN